MCALELYTDRSLRVIRFAAEEARNGLKETGTAHALLALARDAVTPPEREPVAFPVVQLPLREPESEALRILATFEVGPDRLAREVCRAADLVVPEDLGAPGPAGTPGRNYTHDSDVSAAIGREIWWASRRRNVHLSTLHKLVGLLGKRRTVAREVLIELGVNDVKALERAAVLSRAERHARDQQMLRLAVVNPGLERALRTTIPGSTQALRWNRRRLRREIEAQNGVRPD